MSLRPTNLMHASPGDNPDLYSIDGFRQRAQQRLNSHGNWVGGDHLLNPDFAYSADQERKLRDAAVLILAVNHGPDARIVLTQRTAHLRSHAGQIALPGGKIDKEDNGPIAAALREAQEEVGLDPACVNTIGPMGTYMTGSGYKVVPILATASTELKLTPNPDEVEDVFEVPLSFLMNPQNHLTHSREFAGKQRFFYAMPYEDRYIWGVTAGILRCLYNTVYA
ncbi:CoA pyrophosphatase [Pseudovibrio sp. SPO723]|nr:CoA pyrophosphatase [Pseudovibrio sp. SPO723]MDX5595353.1 CoA pyrophosphatase [Pseudovibrio sp. SPO723]